MPGIQNRKMFRMADGGFADSISGNTSMNPGMINTSMPENSGAASGGSATDPIVSLFVNKYGRLPAPAELEQFLAQNITQMADGGMVPTMQEGMEPEMAFMSPQEEAQIYQEAQSLPPEVIQAAGGQLDELTNEMTSNSVGSAVREEAGRSISNMETAGDFKDIMNSVWDQDEGIESYRARLAEVVGPEDAQRTPDSVLALVQPTLQLAQIDQGIGALMQEELADVGGMGGGIAELATKSAVADGMAAETGALVNAVGNMAQGPAGIMATGENPMGMDPMMMQAMMQGAGPMGQGIS
tara:strand:+ start:1335 stop:2225 length:891 start_codon:yes stop_codon:yes gene_type:complete